MENNLEINVDEDFLSLFKSSKLTPEEIQKMFAILTKLKIIYSDAARIGQAIKNAEEEMIKVTAKMAVISNEENSFYKEISERLDMPLEEVKSLVLAEMQQNINQKQN